jgi:3-oxoacyl-[acyl-carrier-protein] synthase II
MNERFEPIVVSGFGAFNAAGADVAEIWRSAVAGRVATTQRNLETGPTLVYAAPELSPLSGDERRIARPADRSALLGLAAATEAWTASGLESSDIDPRRIGVFIGSSRGPVELDRQAALRTSRRPSDSLYTAFSSIAGVIASVFHLGGAAVMSSATCVSGAVALKNAMHMIQLGELDAALVGGVEAPLVDSLLEEFRATGVLSSGDLRPFGLDRDGTLLGEGAAFLVIESASSAQRRRATVHGVVAHVALACDHSHRAGGNRDAHRVGAAVQQTLAALALAPADVNLLHLHGTGTRLNDTLESRTTARVFGEPSAQPWCWASKGITGHTLGASAIFQTVLSLLALRHGFIPGPVGDFKQDPACQVRLGAKGGVAQRLENALCLTTGFWGNSSCIALRRWEPPA